MAAECGGFGDRKEDEDKSCLLPEDDTAESSSSIGVPGDSDVEDDAISTESGVLGSLDSVHDALPIKRGLSNHYAGKSKSFANLSEVSSVSDLEKSENIFNKKRRILRASKWSRKSLLLYSWQNRNSLPLIAALNEDEEEQNTSCLHNNSSSSSSSSLSLINDEVREYENEKGRRWEAALKCQSCFALTDLQEERQE